MTDTTTALVDNPNPTAPGTLLQLREAQIPLQAGEHYAGLVLDAEGRPHHHLVLLAGTAEDLTWDAAQAWAAAAGGVLPARQEQALLYANLRAQFEPEWYWSCEEHKGSFAWYQSFDDGYQGYGRKSFEGRARAVRRFPA